ncbi:MAG: hypothetical protein JST11_13455 [Acidobacteria bacterium]|nr:hypothetical protein [Acidobacteriota bacterium]
MFPYDPQILAAVSAPAPAVADILRAMETIDGVCRDTDGLKWFNRLYLQVTGAVKTRIADGGFTDTDWLARLDVEFAALYFSALRSALSGGAAPGCWRAVFDRRGEAAIARIQFALAGINAHINHDLPFAIVNACRTAGIAPSHALPEYADYTRVNSTLDALVETAKQEFNVRLPGDTLPAVSHLEETVAAFSVSAAREAAWNQAEMLWAIRSFPALTARAGEALDGLAALAGKTLLVPVPAP